MFHKILFLSRVIIFLIPILIQAKQGTVVSNLSSDPALPWFTGPLLTPSAHVVAKGHHNFDLYFYWQRVNHFFNQQWYKKEIPLFQAFTKELEIQIGIFDKVEFGIGPSIGYNKTMGQDSLCYNDLPIGLGFQLLKDTPYYGKPAVKVHLGLNLPIGKYDKGNPNKFGTDFGGTGNWHPSITVSASRLFAIGSSHALASRTCVAYKISTPVSIHGFSIYGGEPDRAGVIGTRGKVYPGNLFVIFQGFEYTLTQNWVLALDLHYEQRAKQRFKGSTPGRSLDANRRQVFSIAPGIEYNFNENVGIVIGFWMSVAGQNYPAWKTAVISLNIYR